MSNTENYNIPYLTPNQTQREDVYNQGMNIIDNNIKTIDDKATASEQKDNEQDQRLDTLDSNFEGLGSTITSLQEKNGQQDLAIGENTTRLNNLNNEITEGVINMAGEVRYFKKGQIPDGWYELSEYTPALLNDLYFSNTVDNYDIQDKAIFNTSSFRNFIFNDNLDLIELNPRDGSLQLYNIKLTDIISPNARMISIPNEQKYMLQKAVFMFNQQGSNILYINVVAEGPSGSQTYLQDTTSKLIKFNLDTNSIEETIQLTGLYIFNPYSSLAEYGRNTTSESRNQTDVACFTDPSFNYIYRLDTENRRFESGNFNVLEIKIVKISLSDGSYNVIDFDLDLIKNNLNLHFFGLSNYKFYYAVNTQNRNVSYSENVEKKITIANNDSYMHIQNVFFDSNEDLIFHMGNQPSNLFKHLNRMTNFQNEFFKVNVNNNFIVLNQAEKDNNQYIQSIINFNQNRLNSSFTFGYGRLGTEYSVFNLLHNDGNQIIFTKTYSAYYNIRRGTTTGSATWILDSMVLKQDGNISTIPELLNLESYFVDLNGDFTEGSVSGSEKELYPLNTPNSYNCLDLRNLLIEENKVFFNNNFYGEVKENTIGIEYYDDAKRFGGVPEGILEGRKPIYGDDSSQLVLAINGVPQ